GRVHVTHLVLARAVPVEVRRARDSAHALVMIETRAGAIDLLARVIRLGERRRRCEKECGGKQQHCIALGHVRLLIEDVRWQSRSAEGDAAARASDTGARGIRRPEELSFRAWTAWGMPLLTDGNKISADRGRVNLSRSEFTIRSTVNHGSVPARA